MDDTADLNRALMLDGNAVAGLLREVFALEMTASPTKCAHCGAVSATSRATSNARRAARPAPGGRIPARAATVRADGICYVVLSAGGRRRRAPPFRVAAASWTRSVAFSASTASLARPSPAARAGLETDPTEPTASEYLR